MILKRGGLSKFYQGDMKRRKCSAATEPPQSIPRESCRRNSRTGRGSYHKRDLSLKPERRESWARDLVHGGIETRGDGSARATRLGIDEFSPPKECDCPSICDVRAIPGWIRVYRIDPGRRYDVTGLLRRPVCDTTSASDGDRRGVVGQFDPLPSVPNLHGPLNPVMIQHLSSQAIQLP